MHTLWGCCENGTGGTMLTNTGVTPSWGRQTAGELTLYSDEPYGRVSRIGYESGDLYLIWTSEHTDVYSLFDMMRLLPPEVSYEGSENFPFIFEEAEHGSVSYFLERR